jgi:hypothetical protein
MPCTPSSRASSSDSNCERKSPDDCAHVRFCRSSTPRRERQAWKPSRAESSSRRLDLGQGVPVKQRPRQGKGGGMTHVDARQVVKDYFARLIEKTGAAARQYLPWRACSTLFGDARSFGDNRWR